MRAPTIRSGSRVRAATTLAASLLTLACALPAASSASSVSYDGDMLVFQAAPGERNFVVVTGQEGEVTFTDDYPIAFPSGCHQDDPEYPVACTMPARGVRVDLGDGDDRASFGFMIPADRSFELDGGAGADLLTGPRNGVGSATLDGGDGMDDLRSEETADTLIGGAGDDKLTGGAGADVLHGGDGSDKLRGDDPSGAFADTLDGGPGADELLDDYNVTDPALAPPVDITLNGVANDGRAGENDNILAVENFSVGAVRTFGGDDADNVFRAPEKGRAAHLMGGGGNDQLTATDSHGDVVEGGAGDDTLLGGFGDDLIVGGPGRDHLVGDRPARCNELHCDFMDGFGNDTIDARDGEVDSVECGPGVDTVRADAVDRVADNCEKVDGAAVGGDTKVDDPHGSTTTTPDPVRPKVALRLAKRPRLRSALRHGLKVRVTGAARPTTVKAKQGRRVVASGRCRPRGGACTATLRFTRVAQRRLKRARRVMLTVSIGGVARKVSLHR